MLTPATSAFFTLKAVDVRVSNGFVFKTRKAGMGAGPSGWRETFSLDSYGPHPSSAERWEQLRGKARFVLKRALTFGVTVIGVNDVLS